MHIGHMKTTRLNVYAVLKTANKPETQFNRSFVNYYAKKIEINALIKKMRELL